MTVKEFLAQAFQAHGNLQYSSRLVILEEFMRVGSSNC